MCICELNQFSGVIFTARKRSLRRLCFHRFLSVHRVAGGGGLGLCPGGSLSGRAPPPYGNELAVRILLECILVESFESRQMSYPHISSFTYRLCCCVKVWAFWAVHTQCNEVSFREFFLFGFPPNSYKNILKQKQLQF